MKEEYLLEYNIDRIKSLNRCKKCLLPETFPFIKYDDFGICNYCNSYKSKNNFKQKDELFNVIEPYRRKKGNDCIVPLSGGRDSCYGLHLVVNELKMKPITYTYDWGMITDLGHRNINRMCTKLGVENILITADISKKIRNISMNLKAWLKLPHLGMVGILTAGDKHFHKYIKMVKKQTGINLSLWSDNPLEITYFKAGFLGIKPNFAYNRGFYKQLRFRYLRLKEMLKCPDYFNRSLWDTLSGEFHRNFNKRKDYCHIFNYWPWDEQKVEDTLKIYNWERAKDTNTTWRVGDGTAAFYNYIHYTVAGFTEHDTFRSNQIREGLLDRERGLQLITEENRPRYPSLKWYIDILGLDFDSTIKRINEIPKLYK